MGGFLGGCGEGSSGPGQSPVATVDLRAPGAVVQFPPDGCLTDAASATLVIAASDETGVELVQAADRSAVLDPDGLWRVTIPLTLGFNLLRVGTRDTRGNQDPFATSLSIQRETTLWIEPTELVLDPASGDALVLDPVMRAILSVAPDGARRVITGPMEGIGPLLEGPRDLDLVHPWGAVVVTDAELDAVVVVELATGTRTLLSSPDVGGGPPLVDPRGIAVDELRSRALVVDPGRGELIGIDLLSAERSTISGDARGTGMSLGRACSVALDSRRDRALVTLESEPVILAVSLTSGNRSVLSGAAVGSGPWFVTPADVAVDVARDRAYVSDPGARSLFELDLTTGARRILTSQSGEPVWIAPAGVAVRFDRVPFVLDRVLDALIEVRHDRRRIVSGIAAGSGPTIPGPVALDASLLLAEHLVVAGPTEFLTVDVADGTRRLLSGGFGRVSAVAASRGPRACFAALDASVPELLAVDRVSGGLRSVSRDFQGPRCMVLEPHVVECASAVLVVDQPPGTPASILRVDLTTGEASVVTDATRGSGADILDPIAIEVDLHPTRVSLLVLDAALRAIHSVDLFTGDRVLSHLPRLTGTPTDFVLDGNGLLMTVVDPPALLAVREQRVTVLASEHVGCGPALGRPSELELLDSPSLGALSPLEVVYVLDAARGCVMALDPRTGDRVIRTK